MKKYQLKAKMLGDAKDKAAREAGEVLLRADAFERRAKHAEAALRGAVEENFRLLRRVEGLERHAISIEENSRLQGLIKKLEAQLGAVEKKAVEATLKALADFRASTECKDEKFEYATDAYDLER